MSKIKTLLSKITIFGFSIVQIWTIAALAEALFWRQCEARGEEREKERRGGEKRGKREKKEGGKKKREEKERERKAKGKEEEISPGHFF